MRVFMPIGLLLGAAAFMSAQEPFYFQTAPPPGTLGARGNVGFIRAVGSGETVKGSPYSAEAVTETTQLLADGNRIVNRTSSKQYRDSEGRERREISFGSAETVLITDPVAGVAYSINSKERTAEKLPVPQVVSNGVESAGRVRSTQIKIEAFNAPSALAIGGPEVMVFNDRQVVARAAGDAGPKVENLGTSSIEGVLAEGTRTRTVIPAGQMGNEKAIEVVGENWYSPDLKMTIMTRSFDPRVGEMVFKLTNISRAEPARALFEVPAGYTVNDPLKGAVGERIKIIQRELH